MTCFSSISLLPQQDLQISRESHTVQPKTGSISTTSRSSMRSEQLTDDNSSISAKSDVSVDSLVFDANFEDRSGEVFSQCSCFEHGDSGTSCLNDDYNWSEELTSQLQSREHVWLLSTNHKGPPKSRSIVTPRWGPSEKSQHS
ncbi:synaptotagmin-C [Elysia marginata]|uniref:Synaptotagmin-C n=1 Tax=Elysia marginata TaxID=1093978 RepID=A0AAV4ESA2_9GAST|nr:synaptotagmin-C [Elysia marginata]